MVRDREVSIEHLYETGVGIRHYFDCHGIADGRNATALAQKCKDKSNK